MFNHECKQGNMCPLYQCWTKRYKRFLGKHLFILKIQSNHTLECNVYEAKIKVSTKSNTNKNLSFHTFFDKI